MATLAGATLKEYNNINEFCALELDTEQSKASLKAFTSEKGYAFIDS